MPSLTTKEQPAETTNDNRGVRCFERPDRPKTPWAVQWRVDGKRKTECFETQKQRDKRAAELTREKKRGHLGTALSREEIQEYRTLMAAIDGRPMAEVLRLLASTPKRPDLPTVRVLGLAYLEEARKLKERGELAEATLSHNKGKVESFIEDFGSLQVERITADDITGWIESKGHKSPATFNTYRRILHHLFEGVGIPNAVDGVPIRDDLTDIVGVLMPEQCATLFAWVAKNEPVLMAKLALEAFAGLRFSSVCRLVKDEVNFAERGLSLPALKIKTRRRQYLDDLPANLWDWLGAAPEEAWTIKAHDYMHKKSAAFRYAGVAHPRNCLRHSFATYHVALHKDAGWTARLLCHRNQQVLYNHYLGRATAKDAVSYFGIIPGGAICRA